MVPFRYQTWIAIGLCAIFGGLIHWIIAKLIPTNNQTNLWKDVCFSVVYNFGSLLGNTLPTDYSPAPIRLFNLSRFLAYFFLTAAFTSSIISYLSVSLREEPINSIKQVAESDLTISGIPDYYDLYINSVNTYMIQSLQRYNKTDENFDQFAYVNARLGACIDSERIISYYTQVIYKDRYYNPTIHIVKQNIAMVQNVALAPKNSIYTDAFSNLSIRLFESGLQQYWTKEAILIAKDKYEQFQPDLYEENKLNFKSFKAPFVVWLFMLVVSIAVFIFERILSRG